VHRNIDQTCVILYLEAVQTGTAKEREEVNFLLDRLCGKPLAKHEQKGYIKREPRLLLAGRNRDWHGAVNAPVHGYQTGYFRSVYSNCTTT